MTFPAQVITSNSLLLYLLVYTSWLPMVSLSMVCHLPDKSCILFYSVLVFHQCCVAPLYLVLRGNSCLCIKKEYSMSMDHSMNRYFLIQDFILLSSFDQIECGNKLVRRAIKCSFKTSNYDLFNLWHSPTYLISVEKNLIDYHVVDCMPESQGRLVCCYWGHQINCQIYHVQCQNYHKCSPHLCRRDNS